LGQKKIALDQFENLRRLLGRAGPERSGMDLRGIMFGLAQRGKRRRNLAFDPTPHLRRGRPHLFDGKRKTGHRGALFLWWHSPVLSLRDLQALIDANQSPRRHKKARLSVAQIRW